jgi:hypothetical protein
MNPANWPKVYVCPICKTKSNASLHCLLPETPTFPKVNKPNAHSYDVEVMKDGMRWMVRNVEAMNRNSAAAKVRKAFPGVEIASVNMVG